MIVYPKRNFLTEGFEAEWPFDPFGKGIDDLVKTEGGILIIKAAHSPSGSQKGICRGYGFPRGVSLEHTRFIRLPENLRSDRFRCSLSYLSESPKDLKVIIDGDFRSDEYTADRDTRGDYPNLLITKEIFLKKLKHECYGGDYIEISYNGLKDYPERDDYWTMLQIDRRLNGGLDVHWGDCFWIDDEEETNPFTEKSGQIFRKYWKENKFGTVMSIEETLAMFRELILV